MENLFEVEVMGVGYLVSKRLRIAKMGKKLQICLGTSHTAEMASHTRLFFQTLMKTITKKMYCLSLFCFV